MISCFPSKTWGLVVSAALLFHISAAPAPARSAGVSFEIVEAAPGASQPARFTHQAVQAGAASFTAWFVRAVLERKNQPPNAVDDTYTTISNLPLAIGPSEGVLANDTDPDNDPLTANLEDSVLHGVLLLSANGSFIYTPAPGYTGTDSFTYKASDGKKDSEKATVTITVAPVEQHQPPIANSDSYLTNQALTIGADKGLLANDSDPDGGTITVASSTQAANGSLTVSTDGSFTYTPNAGYDGTDTFTYTLTNGTQRSQPATVSIRVDITPPPPVIWLHPGGDGSVAALTSGSLILEVRIPSPAPDFNNVTFYRWDPVLNQRVALGACSGSPYTITITADMLRYGWNQIDAAAIDSLGNVSPFNHIWLIRNTAVFLPIVRQ